MRVNQRELSEILDVSTVTLTEWQKAGLPMLERGANGLANEYDTRVVVDWMIQRALDKAKAETPRDRLDKIRAQREELGLRKDIGQLVDAGEIQPLLDRYVSRVTSSVQGIAEKGALLLENVGDADGRYQVLRGLVREVLHALGSFDFDGGGDGASLDVLELGAPGNGAGATGGDRELDEGAPPGLDPEVPPAA